MRLFSSKTNQKAPALETSIEWNTPLTESVEKQIIAIHVSSFLDIYQEYSEEQLGLKPGLTKATWLTKMVEDELEGIRGGGAVSSNNQSSRQHSWVHYLHPC